MQIDEIVEQIDKKVARSRINDHSYWEYFKPSSGQRVVLVENQCGEVCPVRGTEDADAQQVELRDHH